MLKRLLFFILSLVVLYIIGFIGNAFLFILFLNVTFLYLLYFITCETCIYLKTKGQVQKAVIVSLLFLILVGWMLNHFMLPDKFHPVSVAGNIGIFLFTLFLGWSIWKKSKKSLLITGSVIFVLFIFILTIYKSVGQPQAKTDPGLAVQSIPYLSYVVNDKQAEKNGVIKIDTNLVYNGVNLYIPFLRSNALLLDMNGNVLHTWNVKRNSPTWSYVTMLKNGDLLSSNKDDMLLRLDWNSNIKWEKNIRCHHDIAVAENNDIYALSRKDTLVFVYGIPMPMLNDYITVLSSDGKIKNEISLYNVLKYTVSFKNVKEIYKWMINPLNCIKIITNKVKNGFIFYNDTVFDVFHNNTVTIIDKDVEGLCKKGNVLISSRQKSTVGIVDIGAEKLVWSWGPGIINKQHHPTFLENGHILIFDNGWVKKRSRIVEVDPLKRKIVWEYVEKPPELFYSSTAGASQRLPNGNTLITESAKGRVFEVTADGEIVWEFFNPERRKDGKRIVIYRMERITNPDEYPVLKKIMQNRIS